MNGQIVVSFFKFVKKIEEELTYDMTKAADVLLIGFLMRWQNKFVVQC